MKTKLGRAAQSTPLQYAAQQLTHWDRLQSKAEYLSEEWILADEQFDTWLAKWRDLMQIMQITQPRQP